MTTFKVVQWRERQFDLSCPSLLPFIYMFACLYLAKSLIVTCISLTFCAYWPIYHECPLEGRALAGILVNRQSRLS